MEGAADEGGVGEIDAPDGAPSLRRDLSAASTGSGGPASAKRARPDPGPQLSESDRDGGGAGEGKEAGGAVAVALPEGGTPLAESVLAQLQRLLWSDSPEPDDVRRWHAQGLQFSTNESVRWGLRQSSGGPCGVLCAVQALVLRRILFGDAVSPHAGGAPVRVDISRARDAPSAQLRDALAWALAQLLSQAATSGTAGAAGGDGSEHTGGRSISLVVASAVPVAVESAASAFRVYRFDTSEACEAFLSKDDGARVLEQVFGSNAGVLMLVYSALLSRGLDRVKSDTDDGTVALIGRFGHCSQELLNLFTYGEAVSSVFDGTQDVAGGFKLRGLMRTPPIGYLSIMESMRYLEVGTFAKSPDWPFWVIGSQSHYTLLFGCDTSVTEPSLNAAALRAFRVFDEHDNKFIDVEHVPSVLEAMELPIAADEAKCKELTAKVDSGGIVLWSDFWREVRPLVAQPGTDATSGSSSAGGAAAVGGSGSGNPGGAHEAAEGGGPPSYTTTDEELAREMQAQFDAEMAAEAAGPEPAGDAPVVASAAAGADGVGEGASNSAPPGTGDSAADAGSADSSDVIRRFEMWHYNGLEDSDRTPTVSHMVLTQRESEFFDVTAVEGSDGPPPIEAVLRTKWPAATVQYDAGAALPKID